MTSWRNSVPPTPRAVQASSVPKFIAPHGRQMVILGESSVPVTAAHPRAVSCETTAWEGRPKIFLCLLSRGPCEKPCAAGERPDRYTRDDRRRDLWGRAAQLRRRQLDRHSLWRAKSASHRRLN